MMHALLYFFLRRKTVGLNVTTFKKRLGHKEMCVMTGQERELKLWAGRNGDSRRSQQLKRLLL